MTEHYEDIIHNGRVVGQILKSDTVIVPAPVTTMTKLEFMRRFSPEERIKLRSAAATDPILDDGQRLLDLAQEVDVADTDTMRLLGYMASIGLLTPERAAQILTP